MSEKFLVWDIPIRLFHWLLVLTLSSSWITAELGSDYMDFHMICGYMVIFLVVFRVLWGFWGTKHAKFKNFVPSFSDLASYCASFRKNEPAQSPGHNPLGSIMVFIMLFLLLLQSSSGLFVSDDIFNHGPYHNSVSAYVSSLMKQIHHTTFDILLLVTGLHILAIIYYWKIKKTDLLLPMITGNKNASDIKENQPITGSKILLAIGISVVSFVFVYWLVVINIPVVEEYYY